ncbi:hypothetical protein G6F57_018502 [Rhizopus arrhizus]|nr:hypothetical protein G6F57_018502 [Rhizopus arrhizus]
MSGLAASVGVGDQAGLAVVAQVYALLGLGGIDHRRGQGPVRGQVVGPVQIQLVIRLGVDRHAVLQATHHFAATVERRAREELVVLVEHGDIGLVLGATHQRRRTDVLAVQDDRRQVGVVVGVIGLHAEAEIEGVLAVQLHALRNAILAIGPGLVVLHGHHFTADIHLHVAHDRHGEIADVLAEQADTGHGARLEVPFQAEIVLRGLEGLQLLLNAPGVAISV